MNIDTFTLQSFIAVAETQSFTKAAVRLHRTQSAISQQIAKIERELGKRLVNRGRRLSLTADGELFLGYARKIFALHCEAVDRFTEPELEGEVRFGLPEDFATLYLSDVLADFIRIHPRIMLNIECDLTIHLYERFKKREFDLVLVKMNCPRDFPSGLDVWSEPLKWVGDASLIDEEAPIPLVLSPAPCVYRASAIRALEERGRSWRLLFSSPSYASTVAAVRAGMGITVMPHMMVPHKLQAIESPLLPSLADTHVSLLKYQSEVASIDTLSRFVIEKLRR